MNSETVPNFNSRPRVGGDGGRFEAFETGLAISIHAPAWGATIVITADRHHRVISIHAPAWGATVVVLDDLYLAIISIHAPAWGATSASWPAGMRKAFQFTPPRGGRRIAAPAFRWGRYFNSRPRVGGDFFQRAILPRLIPFQFTPPRGGRHGFSDGRVVRDYFNSRPRVGGDATGQHDPGKLYMISIHAPAWGGDSNWTTLPANGSMHFNSRPRVGGDTVHNEHSAVHFNFNSRPRVGGDYLRCGRPGQS